MRRADVAVVGLGAWGACALWRLALAGVDVVGIERHEPGHARGSSHGGSRMYRTACREHPGLVPLARRSRALFAELEAASGRRLVEPGGGLLVGPRDGHLVSGTLAVSRRHGLAVQTLDADAVREAYPAHTGLGEDHVAVRDPTAALIRPEATITAAVDVARAHGARVRTGTTVEAIEAGADGVVVHTDGGTWPVRQVVVCAGPWLAALLPEVDVEAVRWPVTWFRPAQPDRFALERFPVFLRELDGGEVIWGHGLGRDLGPAGEVKLALEDTDNHFEVVDPETMRRTVDEWEWRGVAELLPAAVPGLAAPPSRTGTCLSTRTPDRLFLVGRRRGKQRVVIGGGCGGHGFKHAPGLGEHLAELVLDRTPTVPLEFCDPDRFG